MRLDPKDLSDLITVFSRRPIDINISQMFLPTLPNKRLQIIRRNLRKIHNHRFYAKKIKKPKIKKITVSSKQHLISNLHFPTGKSLFGF